MRLYRGLKEPYRSEKVTPNHGSFTAASHQHKANVLSRAVDELLGRHGKAT